MSDAIRKYAAVLKISGGEVPYRVTKLSEKEFAQVMREGYRLAFGEDPTLEVLAGGWAQAILESGRPGGVVRLPNNNVGNIKAGSDWLYGDGDYFVKDAFEFNKDGERFVVKDDTWRAYSSPEEGAAGYWKLIGNNRYKRSLDWMAAGDSESASVVLGLKGYYTANIKGYAKTSGLLNQEFMRRFAKDFPDLESGPKPAPGEKLALKNRAKDYTDAEKAAIDNPTLATEPGTMIAKKEPYDEEVKDMIDTRLIQANSKLTKMVKNSILKEKLPTSDVLVCVNGDDHLSKLEYARVASSLLRRFVGAEAFVCGDEDGVEIQCSAIGREKTVTGAVQELCELVLKGMNKKIESGISVTILPGLLSRYDLVKDATLISNRRVFNMNRVLHG